MAIGAPHRVGTHIQLPIRYNVSGLETVTTRPTALNSGLVCVPPLARVRDGSVFITIRTTLATGSNSSPLCPDANLGKIRSGRYTVFYLSPDGNRHFLGVIHIPKP